jgi:hypothetical protein
VSARPELTPAAVDLAELVAGLRAAPAEPAHPDLSLVDDDDDDSAASPWVAAR